MSDEVKRYEISSDEFPSFVVTVKKGLVTHTSDDSHAPGAKWETLKAFYETRQYKVEIKEVKNEE